MRYEHLVEVNDPLMPLLPVVTRAQLWQGLVRRAEQPWEFIFGLTGAVVHERRSDGAHDWLTRTLDFGNFQVHDRVRLTPPDETHIETQGSAQFPASTLTIRIEAPQAQALYLRFIYESAYESAQDSAAADSQGELDALTVALRNQAYEQADIDTLVRIRELVESGALD
jgi:hypothetical protein